MKISKAVITAASRRQRTLPLQSLIDSDGVEKSVLTIVVEETLRAGVEDICVVVCPGDEASYAQAAQAYSSRLTFVPQPEPRGHGHAIHCARAFVGQAPFLHLVGDHLYVSQRQLGCAQDLVRVAENQDCTVSAVQPSHERLLPYYGCVGGKRLAGSDLYEIDTVLEKPTPTEAEQRLVVSGLRAGHYLCFFGMHVLTPTVMTILDALVTRRPLLRDITLTMALAELATRERYLAYESSGRRYDVGVKYGVLMAQVALALSGQDREEVLSQFLALLAQRDLDREAPHA